jgi:SagB-type dehydrogenase family enzyme
MPGDETATGTLHRLTSYETGREWDEPIADPRIVQNLEVNDLDRFPWPYKRYQHDLPRRALPKELPTTGASALSVLAGTADVAPAELDVPQLARLLYLTAGVVRFAERHGRRFLFRASGSAGARFPLEVYVAVPAGAALPAGVHWYHPEEHALVEIAPPPAGDAPAIVVTGVPWRTGWRYRERGYRHIYWDAGTMIAQLLAAAASAGLSGSLVTRFPDATVEALVGADGVHEFAVAVVAPAAAVPTLEPAGEAAVGAVDAAPLEFPLVTAAQRAGRVEAWGEPWPAGAPTDAPEGGPPVEEVVLRRSSQRRMDPTRGLSRDLLATSMAAAMRGIDVPHWVVVHDVHGLTPGVYRWPDLAAPVRPESLRDELYRVALDQGLPRDAAFVVVSAARLAELDDRSYREAQLSAGIVEGRLHLAAYAQDAGASGMTFLDSEIAALLGEPVEGLLFTCVGVPEYTPKPAGRPGSPTAFRPVTPRLDDA